MTFNELVAQVRSILPDATLWQDNDGEICVATKLTYPPGVTSATFTGDEQLHPFSED